MVMTDPIADMLTRIRNANQMSHAKVLIPASKLKLEILSVLKTEGFIKNFYLPQSSRDIIVSLKYAPNKEKVIKGLKRVSKPGLRVYATAQQIPKVLNGLGVALVSTSKGILTDSQARISQVGGEILAYVW
ncbi:30S ribosomal protein S8 [Candidatus Phytoplasma australiense]|uniref:Small ribosomal subunit protein uS8 n=2 Tax=Phytoplasma australiense TaxID=59748 RepID=RS8_PHYAS|nr:30S ribosomal protein S8 [Candidatus Phytoplasma australiense]B1VAD4.1 RecName: Full=Small ribosomal subunit protein uS8; AltName: Full=30S ribosomal protein S8 [Candidatus Phytoplasma australiense]AGL90294.1 30S ribosomal protein S8 [Strawberry lethal yellows phytoplasma (CPA) str. NZSb11]CAM11907.1 30S ribosomal protein S8 [Candidatus Phytoplasma australiense]